MSSRKRASDELWVCQLGVVPYGDALAVQTTIRERRQDGEIPDTLLVLEHPPTYTRGRRSGAQDLPLPESFYRDRGIDVCATDRGGKLTYHAPGQLVGYPIMAVEDVSHHLRTMEDAIIAALEEVGVAARSRHREGIDYTGVWVHERKIASIGVHISRGISTHGFAVNVCNDLEPFDWVVACGLPDVAMTSLARESAGTCESSACFRKRLTYSFCRAHARRQRLVSPWRVGIDTAHPSSSSVKTISSPALETVPA